MGRPLSDYDEVEILGPGTEGELPDGEIGELAIRGPCTIAGYYDAEDRNQVAFTTDGFYRSGDLIRINVIDDRRYLVFEGRIKDVVSRGGEKINCEESSESPSSIPTSTRSPSSECPTASMASAPAPSSFPAPGKTVSVSELGAFSANRASRNSNGRSASRSSPIPADFVRQAFQAETESDQIIERPPEDGSLDQPPKNMPRPLN